MQTPQMFCFFFLFVIIHADETKNKFNTHFLPIEKEPSTNNEIKYILLSLFTHNTFLSPP